MSTSEETGEILRDIKRLAEQAARVAAEAKGLVAEAKRLAAQAAARRQAGRKTRGGGETPAAKKSDRT
jgi:hypothetical protein